MGRLVCGLVYGKGIFRTEKLHQSGTSRMRTLNVFLCAVENEGGIRKGILYDQVVQDIQL